MAQPLENFKQFIGKSETTMDVVTASMALKFAATLGLEKAPTDKGEELPPGWYGGLFPASHRPDKMRPDGQASGGGIVPAIPLPRRRIGGTRVAFHEPLRIGDEVTRKTEIADIQIDDDGAVISGEIEGVPIDVRIDRNGVRVDQRNREREIGTNASPDSAQRRNTGPPAGR